MRASNFDPAGVLMQMSGTELNKMIMDVVELITGPVTAPDDQAQDLNSDSFDSEAVGRILLEVLGAGDATCTTTHTAIARAVTRFTAEILTEDGQRTDEVLAALQHAAEEQLIAAYEAPRAGPLLLRGIGVRLPGIGVRLSGAGQ
ncbi:hypothetical protein ACFV14_37130 [Streptomyces zaomyceticus]|uniref:hypothetical protein n=1 Tax=Streptomyces zaomyceticus TaxID=68286 RepID=UPI0036C2B64A